MTAVTENARRIFELTQKIEGFVERVEFTIEDDDGVERLFADGIELTANQCLKLETWLGNARRTLTESNVRTNG